MTETQLKQKAFEWFRANLPGAFVQKLSDRFSHGVPDCTVTWKGPTTWIEMKVVRRGQNLADTRVTKPVQVAVCKQLHRASYGRCWFLVYDVASREFRGVSPFLFPEHSLASTDLGVVLRRAFDDDGTVL